MPTGADIWVSGVSCVDFSKLNNKANKDTTVVGESADTFVGLLNAIKRFRPPIVLIENVQTAPWEVLSAAMENDRDFVPRGDVKGGQKMSDDQVIDALDETQLDGMKKVRKQIMDTWDELDPAYATSPVKVDTKQFYIPQTRSRGYMLCLDRARFSEADTLVQTWVRVLSKLQRCASSSLDEFLLPDNDPRIQRARIDLTRKYNDDKKSFRAEVPWSRCQTAYSNYRLEHSLGNQRPITQWINGGLAKAQDYMSQAYINAQVERVLDTIEISALRSASRGYDGLYKT